MAETDEEAHCLPADLGGKPASASTYDAVVEGKTARPSLPHNALICDPQISATP